MSRFYDCRPNDSPSVVIEAARALHLSWFEGFCEHIDNSCDFGASKITITFGEDMVSVEDDGEGCEDLSCLIAPGRHGMPRRNKRARIGRYGVGMKDADMRFANELSIRSRCEGVEYRASILYQDMIDADSWKVEGEDPEPSTGPSGLKITLRQLLLKKRPDYNNLLESLGSIYGPGINQGEIQIILNTPKKKGLHVKAVTIPLSERRDATVEISHRKKIEMYAGFISNQENRSKQGVWIAYGFRVVLEKQSLGLGDKPTPGLYIFCQLSGDWSLGRHKDSLDENERDLIASAIRKEFGTLIYMAQSRGEDVELDSVNSILSGLHQTANEILKQHRKRQPPDSECNGNSNHRGRGILPYKPRLRERITQTGTKELLESVKAAEGLTLSRQPLMPADPLFSMNDPDPESKTAIVVLNTAHPAYVEFGKEVGEVWGLLALMFFCQQESKIRQFLLPELKEMKYEKLVSVLLHSYWKRQFSNSANRQTGNIV